MEAKKINRPWGYYVNIDSGKNYLTKIIYVMPFQKLSLQSHQYRAEHWVVLEGIATVLIEQCSYDLNIGRHIDIKICQKHSLQNNTDSVLKILEIQTGEFLSEEDIIRYEDMYGRV